MTGPWGTVVVWFFCFSQVECGCGHVDAMTTACTLASCPIWFFSRTSQVMPSRVHGGGHPKHAGRQTGQLKTRGTSSTECIVEWCEGMETKGLAGSMAKLNLAGLAASRHLQHPGISDTASPRVHRQNIRRVHRRPCTASQPAHTWPCAGRRIDGCDGCSPQAQERTGTPGARHGAQCGANF